MTVPIVHPRFAQMHRQFFAVPVRVQEQTGTTQDAYGQEQEVWTDVIATGATMAPMSGTELQAAGYTATAKVWDVDLLGDYPQVTTKHRLTINTKVYDIDSVVPARPGYEATTTRLRVSQTTT